MNCVGYEANILYVLYIREVTTLSFSLYYSLPNYRLELNFKRKNQYKYDIHIEANCLVVWPKLDRLKFKAMKTFSNVPLSNSGEDSLFRCLLKWVHLLPRACINKCVSYENLLPFSRWWFICYHSYCHNWRNPVSSRNMSIQAEAIVLKGT
jgi:hypothetical protein